MAEDRRLERTLLVVNSFTGAGLTLDKVKGTAAPTHNRFNEIMKGLESRGFNR